MSRAALSIELLKLRRATAPRVAGLVLVLGVPGLTAALVAAAQGPGDSAMARKVRPMVVGTGWEAFFGSMAQVMSVAVLLAVGIVVAWSFGREHTDGTFGGLFALPTARRDLALAKLGVVLGWGLLATTAAVVLAVPVGVVAGLGLPGPRELGLGALPLAVGALTVALTTPLALVASIGRGYLPAIAVLLGIVAVTQIVTLTGAGAWFPYAAPALWAGMGGQAAMDVSAVQLLLALPVGAVAAVVTARWWARAQVR